MAESENLERVLVLTSQHRIEGQMQVGPDGSIWDFKHRAADRFMTVHNALFVDRATGQQDYDAVTAEVNKDHVVTLFREKNLVFMRKDES